MKYELREFGYKYKKHYLGEKVIESGYETEIIGFNEGNRYNDEYIAIKITNGRFCDNIKMKNSIHSTSVLKNNEEELYCWVREGDIISIEAINNVPKNMIQVGTNIYWRRDDIMSISLEGELKIVITTKSSSVEYTFTYNNIEERDKYFNEILLELNK